MNECRVCGARTDGKRLCSDCEMQVIDKAASLIKGGGSLRCLKTLPKSVS